MQLTWPARQPIGWELLHLVQGLNPPKPWLRFLKTGGSFHSGLNIDGELSTCTDFRVVTEILEISRLLIPILPTQFQEIRGGGSKLCLLASQDKGACCFPTWSALTSSLFSHPPSKQEKVRTLAEQVSGPVPVH